MCIYIIFLKIKISIDFIGNCWIILLFLMFAIIVDHSESTTGLQTNAAAASVGSLTSGGLSGIVIAAVAGVIIVVVIAVACHYRRHYKRLKRDSIASSVTRSVSFSSSPPISPSKRLRQAGRSDRDSYARFSAVYA